MILLHKIARELFAFLVLLPLLVLSILLGWWPAFRRIEDRITGFDIDWMLWIDEREGNKRLRRFTAWERDQ